jgi:hypothetical protein
MSTQINVTISDQHLLQDSKRRAAANQQALDSRTQQQQLEQQAANAIEEASPEERPSDVPSPLLARRPAAQRRKGDKYNLAILGNLRPSVVINSLEVFNPGSWPYTYQRFYVGAPERISCPAEAPPSPNDFPYTLTNEVQERAIASTAGITDNYHTDFTFHFSPTLVYLTVVQALPPYIQTQTTEQLSRWLLSIRNFITEFTTVCGSPFRATTFSGFVDSAGFTFPRQNVYSRFRVDLQRVTTTPDYVYFSALLRTQRYDLAEQVGGSYSTIGFNASNETRTVTTRNFTSVAYGYYVRFNTRTGIAEPRLTPLETSFLTSLPSPSVRQPTDFIPAALQNLYVSNFYADDPRRILYQNATNLIAALDPDVSNFGYNPKNGAVYFYGTTVPGSSTDIFIYSGKVTTNKPYAEVVPLLKTAKAKLALLSEAPRVLQSGFPPIDFKLRQTLPFTQDASTIIGIVPQKQ